MSDTNQTLPDNDIAITPEVRMQTDLLILHACGFTPSRLEGADRLHRHSKDWPGTETRPEINAYVAWMGDERRAPGPWMLTMYENLGGTGDVVTIYSHNPARLDALADRLADFWGAK